MAQINSYATATPAAGDKLVGTDVSASNATRNFLVSALAAYVAGQTVLSGLAAARPAAGTAGRLYYATDTEELSRDNGSSWDAITTGGAGAVESVNGETGAVTLSAADVGADATGTAAAAVAAHEAALDPHPQYLTAAEGGAAYQPIDSDLTAIAALSTTSYGRALLALADAAALRTAAGLGTAATAASGDFEAAGAVAAHAADTTSVHGIADTADLILEGDSRLTDARTPTGSAGGVLSGTYPNPGFASDMATQAELDAHAADTTSVHGIADTSTLYAAGGADVALADGGTGASLTDPGGDRIMFWDDSAGAVTWLSAGTGLSITDTTIAATGGGGGGGDSTTSGTYASLPAAGNDGNLYLPTDSPYILRDTGSAWVPFGPINRLTIPPSSGWSWVNQGSATVDQTYGPLRMTTPAAANTNPNYRIYARTAPSTPYTITAAVQGILYNSTGFPNFGVGWRQSSDGKLVLARWVYNSAYRFGVITASSATTDVADVMQFNPWIHRDINWIQLTDNGTNRIVRLSGDGHNWIQVLSEGRTTYATGDQVCVFLDSRNTTYAMAVTLLSWEVT